MSEGHLTGAAADEATGATVRGVTVGAVMDGGTRALVVDDGTVGESVSDAAAVAGVGDGDGGERAKSAMIEARRSAANVWREEARVEETREAMA
jgi:hypothetical protein